MLNVNIDATVFNRGMAGLVQKLGIESKKVVAKETGELLKTLVKVSPPADRMKSLERIRKRVDIAFDALAQDVNFKGEVGGEKSKKYPGLTWYSVDSQYLRGIAGPADMRKASVPDLRRVFLRTRVFKRGARQIFQFPDGRAQRIVIKQQIATDKKKRDALTRLLAKSIGRLKAAWLVPVFRGAISLYGANLPPAWVKQHATGARGTYANGLNNQVQGIPVPTFAITNFAKGIGQRGINFIVQKAMTIRGKAMEQNTALILKGKKRVSDYA